MKTVTITQDEFHKVVDQANKKFLSIGEDKADVDPLAGFVMGLQNITFGAMLSEILFDSEEEL